MQSLPPGQVIVALRVTLASGNTIRLTTTLPIENPLVASVVQATTQAIANLQDSSVEWRSPADEQNN